jgi:hypothetical protein
MLISNRFVGSMLAVSIVSATLVIAGIVTLGTFVGWWTTLLTCVGLAVIMGGIYYWVMHIRKEIMNEHFVHMHSKQEPPSNQTRSSSTLSV